MLWRLVAIIAIVGAADSALAGSELPETDGEPERSGLVLGVNLGLGSLHGSPALEAGWRVGYMMTPRLAGLLEVSGAMAPTGGATSSNGVASGTFVSNQTFVGPAVQAWVRPRLWLRGGLGISSVLGTRDGDDLPERDVGAMFAAGVHLAGSRGLTLDFQLSSRVTAYGLSPVADAMGSFGVAWY